MDKVDEPSCRKLFCSNSIYSIKDWRQAMLNKKKSLINQGITNFENHPEYANLSQCKSNINDRFDTEKLCSKLLKKKSKRDTTLDESAERYNNFGSVPRKQPKKSKRQSSPQTKRQRCPKGSRWNKKTKSCRATSARASSTINTPSPTRKQSASTKLPRCPKGSRRDKKTKDCVRK